MRLFVGQIPREWTETEVLALFCTYGEIEEVNVLRHHDSHISKGCAFVTFAQDANALTAIAELHDKYSPSEGRKIQVRDSTAPRETTETGRLYCANLAETTNGNELFELFSQVGRVLSVSILMTPFNRPKCSCLVEMATKSDATKVIETFHGKVKLIGAHSEMTVTWAKNNGSRNKPIAPIFTQGVYPGVPASPMQSPTGAFMPPPSPNGQGMYAQPMYMQPTPNSYYAAQPAPQTYFAAPHQMMYYEEQQIVEEEKSDEGMSMYSMNMQQAQQSMQQQSLMIDQQVQYPVPYVFIAVPVSHVPPQSPLMTSKRSFSRRRSSSSIVSSPSPTLRYREGPTGANLFVKNFPLEWEKIDLLDLFEKFGEIISCNVFIDKVTGKSRGFGFVSFATKEQASAAIQQVNGMTIGDTTLVVEIKLKQLHSAGSSLSVLDSDDTIEEEIRS